MARYLYLATVVFLLAGCVEKWTKPGATAAEFDATLASCKGRAYSMAPPQLQQMQISSGYTTPITTSCSGYGFNASCVSTGGAYIPPAFITVDNNEGQRGNLVRSCLYSNGWTPEKKQ